MITALRDRSEGLFDLAEGTVYPALHRLERDGLVTSRWDETTPRRRRVYELTDDGHRAQIAKKQQWHGFMASVQGIVGPVAQGARHEHHDAPRRGPH